MNGLNLFEETEWHPLSAFGLTHPFFSIDYTIVMNTWFVIAILIILLILINYFLYRKEGIAYFLVLSYVDYFMKLCEQTLGSFSFTHFCFITGLFTFIFLCNAISIFPWIEEPTKDLNTTLALGIISFLYCQLYAIKIHGITAYFKEYLSPFFLMLPLNIVGRLATIISISFRLFGNIFGGAIISKIYLSSIQGSFLLETLGLITGVNLLITIFFGIFEGFLQAFVFSMLTLTYLSIAIFGEAGEQEESA